MSRRPEDHRFDQFKLAEEVNQKAIDRILQHETDTRQRVDTLIKAIFVLSGGALTISIGLFLRSGAPQLSEALIRVLQQSWWLLFYSLAASATVLAIMIFQGYRYVALWKKAFNENSGQISDSFLLKLTRIANWSLGVTGFTAFLIGLALLAYVSVTAMFANSDMPPISTLRNKIWC
jgi:hypothetical protein